MSVCPECGGETKYDPRVKRYVCQCCGLSLTLEERDKLRESNVLGDEAEEKEKRRKDYMKWWASKK